MSEDKRTTDTSLQRIIEDLNERAKELNCLYYIEEILRDRDADLEKAASRMIEVMPSGWQYTQLCRVRIIVDSREFTSKDFSETPWSQSAPVFMNEEEIGKIEVFYIEEVGAGPRSPFLKEEQKLLNTIADRFGHFLLQLRLQQSVVDFQNAKSQLENTNQKHWEVVVELLKKTDRKLFAKISRKMLNHLCWIGIEEARLLLDQVSMEKGSRLYPSEEDANKPSVKSDLSSSEDLPARIFSIARSNLNDAEILEDIQKWIKENRVGFLVKALENLDTSLGDIFDAISRYHHMEEGDVEITPYTKQNISALLIHRLFTDQLDFIDIAKEYVDLHDFYDILRCTIYPQNSHGRLGGKSAGLFIAGQILKRYAAEKPSFGQVQIPKTWYMTSDALQNFLSYNDLEEILEQKYKSVEQIREEYPNIVQIFKNSLFPGDITNWLSACLDDFGESPIIVRSSSLLEDRMESAFSGKYKSLFLANQGAKGERLGALMDAIAEIYASVFAPDPIEYRRERGLTNFHEEMGIMIQEVVGTRVGRYFLPEFAGVAFSNNEFRWSPRIRREDGLIRLVPGLGTRAVDRLSDDYPKLIAPGQPGLNVNATIDETLYYSPRQTDVIDLEHNSFVTVDLKELIKEFGGEYPNLENVVSVHQDGMLRRKSRINLDVKQDDLVVTFDGVISNSTFIQDVKGILDLLRDKLGKPVDIEFAMKEGRIFLLQCRAQSSSSEDSPVPIPKDIPGEKILFTARKYISNGRVPDLTHVVYVVPEYYGMLGSAEELKRVGRAVGQLNSLLPKRQFLLMGPGRWGSRGDIKLGVPVSYSEINNTAVLVEIARRKGNYVPDLSFGTHFFQDLVESSIRYLPLYPDESETIFNEAFLQDAENVLPQLLPEYEDLCETLRVIDVAEETNGEVLRVVMNAEAGEALAYLTPPDKGRVNEQAPRPAPALPHGEHWRWRMRSAERIAELLNPKRFGVEAIYVIGSTKNATASPASDIDLLVHFRGTEQQKRELLAWFEGWSLSLAEMNYMRTGFNNEHMLDIHMVTDENIKRKTSYAVKIGAVTDPARQLPLNR